jgi:UDP-N-acetylglucosamine 2-epimerase (non-hydrolysing)
MLTTLSIVGTRPEAIKMAPVLKQLARYPGSVRSVLCSAGQHREMLQSVFDVFGITPDVHLDLMEPDQRLSMLAGRLFSRFDTVVREVRPDWVLAQGDTATVFVASIVSFYNRVRFGHVEAGLRTDDRAHPFPEEIHRRVADLAADLLFAPTAGAARALLREGHRPSDIIVTGNTVIDALQEVAARPYDWTTGPLAQIGRERRLVLVTAHRRESFGRAFGELCRAIGDLAGEFAPHGVRFVFPVHLNPNVRRPVYETLSTVPGLTLMDPLDYVSFVHLMKRCELVLTDSGGIQEEAPGLNVPALVMRETTERPEGLAEGAVELVGTSYEAVVSAARRHLRRPPNGHPRPVTACPYGDGRAAERIVSTLLDRAGVALDPAITLKAFEAHL